MLIRPAGSYALMRQYYKKSNEYLAKALEIDESGKGRAKINGFLEEIRQHFELRNTKNKRRIRSTEIALKVSKC